jgi:hypothetical protein
MPKYRHPSPERKVVYAFLFVIPEVFCRGSRWLSKIPDKNTSGMTSNCQLIYEADPNINAFQNHCQACLYDNEESRAMNE